MSDRKLFILGTASLVPTAKRNHNGYFLRWDNEGFLFDPGEGTQRQFTFSGISSAQITKIFISHFHGDHCLGLPGIIQRMSLDQVKHPVTIYYPAASQKYFNNLLEASVYFNQLKIRPQPIFEPGIIFENKLMQIIASRLEHPIDTFGFRIQERDGFTLLPDKLKTLGITGPVIKKMIEEKKVEINNRTVTLEEVSHPKLGQSFAYILDTKYCQAAVELAKNVDLAICDSTYLSDREEMAKQYGHMTAADAARLAKASCSKKLVLTHFSQIYPDGEVFLAEARVIFKNVTAANDGDVVVLPMRKRQID